jgi:hypothetical protein
MASRATAYRPVTSVDQRGERRLEAQWRGAEIRGAEGEPVAASLVEISIYGCRLACDQRFDIETRVWLRLDGGAPVSAKVVWCADGRVGCRFDTAIPREQLRALTIRPV